ncbi:hypothetical protein [Cryobacterium psychrophilum]|uniref:Head-tail adaptor protein n=1 Tax=Cryobacterium psychrophilum TaxID=41988 RepID=A0A4Y8KSC4_9MICO|nr:hypothetical protein [Cryobacterium psychrophilum]TDW31020.1 hypothetical protein EDD25_2808 [Cryobacterium psychrophilum]TFD80873.1 hypothetical protein E3T53_04430 [Cryobacterium psychrophilum]
MDLLFGQAVFRDRRKSAPDPYNPGSTIPGSWSDPDTVTIQGAFVASSSSSSVATATRTQTLTAKSLFCDAASDVLVGDRIRAGAESYQVDAKPAADVNPFTGWQPAQEIPLEEASG